MRRNKEAIGVRRRGDFGERDSKQPRGVHFPNGQGHLSVQCIGRLGAFKRKGAASRGVGGGVLFGVSYAIRSFGTVICSIAFGVSPWWEGADRLGKV